jgi:hypothetical protein
MYICADLNITQKQLNEQLTELLKTGMILFDEKVNLMVIVNHLKHNKIENEKQAIGMAKVVSTLPKSYIIQEVTIQLRKQYHKPLVKALRELYAIPEEKEKEKTEEEEKEKLIAPSLESSEPPVISLTLNDKSSFNIYQKSVSNWSELFPAVDVLQSLRHMKAWGDANPTKRKTAKGVEKFIVSWLTKEQDKGGKGSSPVDRRFETQKTKGNMDLLHKTIEEFGS